MATTTPNIGLTLPLGTENVSRQVINANWTLIDTEFGNRKVITTETRTLNIPSVPAHTAVGARIVRSISEISNSINVLGYEIFVSSDSDMTALINAPYTISVSVIHNSNHTPDTHDRVCLDVIQNQDNSSSVDMLSVVIKTYGYSNAQPISL